MKTRLLKKIRSRYKYHFASEGVFDVCVLDIKSKLAVKYLHIAEFIQDYAFDHLGFWTASNYIRRKQKVKARNRFYRELKKIKPQSI